MDPENWYLTELKDVSIRKAQIALLMKVDAIEFDYSIVQMDQRYAETLEALRTQSPAEASDNRASGSTLEHYFNRINEAITDHQEDTQAAIEISDSPLRNPKEIHIRSWLPHLRVTRRPHQHSCLNMKSGFFKQSKSPWTFPQTFFSIGFGFSQLTSQWWHQQ